MKQTVNFFAFERTFFNAGRRNQFTPEALRALYDYLEETDPDYELDVVALCCEYTEEDIADLVERLCIDTEDMDADEIVEAVLDELNRETSVVGAVDGGARIVYLEY